MFENAELFCGLLLPFHPLLFLSPFTFCVIIPFFFSFVSFLLTCIYHKLRKAFFLSLLPTIRVDCLNIICLKTLLQQGISEPVFMAI